MVDLSARRSARSPRPTGWLTGARRSRCPQEGQPDLGRADQSVRREPRTASDGRDVATRWRPATSGQRGSGRSSGTRCQSADVDGRALVAWPPVWWRDLRVLPDRTAGQPGGDGGRINGRGVHDHARRAGWAGTRHELLYPRRAGSRETRPAAVATFESTPGPRPGAPSRRNLPTATTNHRVGVPDLRGGGRAWRAGDHIGTVRRRTGSGTRHMTGRRAARHGRAQPRCVESRFFRGAGARVEVANRSSLRPSSLHRPGGHPVRRGGGAPRAQDRGARDYRGHGWALARA